MKAVKVMIFLTFLVLYEGVNAGELPTIYENARKDWPEWVAMYEDPACGNVIFNHQQGQTQAPTTLDLHIWHYYLTSNFIYDSSVYDLGEVWCDKTAEYESGAEWEGVCTTFVMTAVEQLILSGIPRSSIYLATGVSYLRQIQNLQYDGYHPLFVRHNHIVVMVWAQGEYWILDNREETPVRFDETFGNNGLKMNSISNMGNYGPGTDNDVKAGWARATVYE